MMDVNQRDSSIAGVDLEKLAAIRRKYEAEARKRLRPEGLGQFVPLRALDNERSRSLSDDPWVDHATLNTQSPPIRTGETYKHLVLGAGFGGLIYAIELIESGVAAPEDIRIVDAAGGFGGTW